MIRSKAALIEALEVKGARLFTGPTFRSYVSAPGKASETVHAGAIKAIHDSLVETDDGTEITPAFRLHWIDAPAPDAAESQAYDIEKLVAPMPDNQIVTAGTPSASPGLYAQMIDRGMRPGFKTYEDAVPSDERVEPDNQIVIMGTRRMSRSVRMQQIGRMLGKTSVPARVTPSDERVQNLVNNTETPTDYSAAMDTRIDHAGAGFDKSVTFDIDAVTRRLVETPQTLAYSSIANALKYGQENHVCPVTGRRAMTLQNAARYKLKEGERMHLHSKLPGKTWRRVAVIICTNDACRMQWFGGGWRDIDRNRIVYIGE